MLCAARALVNRSSSPAAQGAAARRVLIGHKLSPSDDDDEPWLGFYDTGETTRPVREIPAFILYAKRLC